MEPVAELLEDVFIFCFAWRYWIVGSILLAPVAILLARLMFSRLRRRSEKSHAEYFPHYGSRLGS